MEHRKSSIINMSTSLSTSFTNRDFSQVGKYDIYVSKQLRMNDEYHLFNPQETHTLCVFDQLPVVSWRRAKYKQMYGLKSTLTVSR